MGDLIASGRMVDIILLLVAAEALAVIVWRAATGRGPKALPFVANLLAGAFLLLALRNALSGAAVEWIAACLTAAFVAHLADLWLRWDWTARATPRLFSSPGEKSDA